MLVIENDYQDEPSAVIGFPTEEIAREYARRRTRDSLEELRTGGALQPGGALHGAVTSVPKVAPTDQDLADAKRLWLIYGESCSVVGECGYRASSEIDEFLRCPATAVERDWRAIETREPPFDHG